MSNDLSVSLSDFAVASCNLMVTSSFLRRALNYFFIKALSDFRLPQSDPRLPLSDLRLPHSDLRIQPSDLRLPPSDLRLPPSDLRLPPQ